MVYKLTHFLKGIKLNGKQQFIKRYRQYDLMYIKFKLVKSKIKKLKPG